MSASTFPSLVQLFFTDRLRTQVGASPHTIAAYRDTFRLLLRFASKQLRRVPSQLRTEDIDAPFLGKFLEHLERTCGNSARTRNNRLAALHAFFRYVAVSEPGLALHCQRILAMPSKRYDRGPVAFVTEKEAAALVAAPNPKTWIGKRDRALLLVAIQTGLRNSEISSLRRQDVELGAGSHVRCLGKGRKMRCTPLRSDVVKILREWMSQQGGKPEDPVFPSSNGGRLSADALQQLVARHLATARKRCPTLASKTVTPHTLRHGAAMAMLRSGVDLSVIALWLGHESTETTQMYLHADMQLKERALAHATPSGIKPARFKPKDALLAFLESL
ncbi:MAG TPA: tyrosine-type recombinase/integrase [Bryobacteraceae bacterium]|nr:tyrosine-type recombinase/integrase [Bryobacteraceae bacterium]